MAELDSKTQEKIQELQGYEQTIQNLLMQKQAFSVEVSETENALAAITESDDDIFKLVGNIIIKTDKDKVKKELTKKNELLNLRLKSIESQESEVTKKAEEIKKIVMGKVEIKLKEIFPVGFIFIVLLVKDIFLGFFNV